MKLLKYFFISFFILSFILAGLVFSEKRDLSTPLSRLIGHWLNPLGHHHWYFGPVDPSTMTGPFVVVYAKFNEEAIRERWNDYFNSIKKQIEDPRLDYKAKEFFRKQLNEKDEFINSVLEDAKKNSEVAIYRKYKVISQIPAGEKIIIEIFWEVFDFDSVPSGEQAFLINNNGEQMIMEGSDWTYAWKYIDSKKSPENNK